MFYISINHICFFFHALGSNFKFKVSSFILSIYKMSKALDPFWEWGTPVDQLNRQILTCNLCGKRMTSGISRLKYHLAQIAGHDVGPCNQTTPELIAKATEAIQDNGLRKQYKEAVRKQIASRSGSTTGVGASGTSPYTNTHSTQQSTSPFIVSSRCNPSGQPSIGPW